MERLCADRNKVLDEVFALEDLLAEHMKELSPIEQSMIIDRYMNGKSWRKIQEEYGYEEAQPYRIVGGAINFQSIFVDNCEAKNLKCVMTAGT